MRHRQLDSKIALQAALLLVAAAGAAYWHLVARQQPLDAAQLHILAAQLQSQAAEAADLADKEARGTMTASFAGHHAAQLRKHTSDLSIELSGARVGAEYRDSATNLSRISAQLARQLAEIRPDYGIAASSSNEFARLTRQAEAIHQQLTRRLP